MADRKKRKRRRTDQPDLFVNVRPTDPDTSHAAAKRSPGARARDRREVLWTHAAHPEGLTDFELADLVDGQQTSQGKRRGELRDGGYVEDSGMRRPSPSGSPSIVWRITPKGVGAVQAMSARPAPSSLERTE